MGEIDSLKAQIARLKDDLKESEDRVCTLRRVGKSKVLGKEKTRVCPKVMPFAACYLLSWGRVEDEAGGGVVPFGGDTFGSR